MRERRNNLPIINIDCQHLASIFARRLHFTEFLENVSAYALGSVGTRVQAFGLHIYIYIILGSYGVN